VHGAVISSSDAYRWCHRRQAREFGQWERWSIMNLPLHQYYFTIVNKVGPGFRKKNQYTENYLDGQLITLFTFTNFCKNADEYTWRHGRRQNWTGLVK
jgi:hypothetical protein